MIETNVANHLRPVTQVRGWHSTDAGAIGLAPRWLSLPPSTCTDQGAWWRDRLPTTACHGAGLQVIGPVDGEQGRHDLVHHEGHPSAVSARLLVSWASPSASGTIAPAGLPLRCHARRSTSTTPSPVDALFAGLRQVRKFFG
jgi:hypothetical protein